MIVPLEYAGWLAVLIDAIIYFFIVLLLVKLVRKIFPRFNIASMIILIPIALVFPFLYVGSDSYSSKFSRSLVSKVKSEDNILTIHHSRLFFRTIYNFLNPVAFYKKIPDCDECNVSEYSLVINSTEQNIEIVKISQLDYQVVGNIPPHKTVYVQTFIPFLVRHDSLNQYFLHASRRFSSTDEYFLTY